MKDEPHTRRHLGGAVSPPPVKRQRLDTPSSTPSQSGQPSPAAIEAGKEKIDDHVTYFLRLYEEVRRENVLKAAPSLSLTDFAALYTRHAGKAHGHNYVIHQHDHPRAGLHYDLRLQINPNSSCSWSIPYGLPGNPWERRQGRRQAIETRIHCLWNHLVEAASKVTGSMLIWDIGEYEVLPYEEQKEEMMTEDEESEVEGSDDDDFLRGGADELLTEPERLERAFRAGKIRLRLHGTKLPPDYTITLRLSRDRGPAAKVARKNPARSESRKSSQMSAPVPGVGALSADAQDFNDDDLNEDPDSVDEIRTNNAYPGSANTVDSEQQRWWFLAMDKANCGFVKGKSPDGKVTWAASNAQVEADYPFSVRGRDFESSVVTGRKAADVLQDEGVEGFVPRGGWKAAV